jgi:hypothetical protein
VIRTVYALVGTIALAACEAPPAEELIEFEVQTVSLVDVACNPEDGVCQGDDVVDAVVDFAAGVSVVTATVEFLQYEVSYDFGEGVLTPPEFGSPLQLTIASGTQRNFSLRTAGTEQRQWVAAYFPQTRMEGKGQISLQGYDQKNNIVLVKTRFDVVFDDFVGGGDTTAP